MKHFTLIACTVFIVLTAFTFSEHNKTIQKACSLPEKVIKPPIFSYHLSTKTNNTISKEKLQSAITIADLFPDFQMQENVKNKSIALKDVKISIVAEHGHCSKASSTKRNGNKISKDQANLLRSAEYFTNIKFEGFAVPNDMIPDLNKRQYFNYEMTVVPETPAYYKGGKMALINFMKTNCQSVISNVEDGNLKAGAIRFTVTRYGTIDDVHFDSTCGYPSVDIEMLDLIHKLPNGWEVASNGKGEKLEQTLVFSYGVGGC